jgi:hypothetical protein
VEVGIELTGHDARRQAGVGGQYLVRPDHREPVADQQHDARAHASELGWHLDENRAIGLTVAVGGVEPVDAEQVQRMRRIRIDGGQRRLHGLGHQRGIGELRKGRQHDARAAEVIHRVLVSGWVDERVFKSKTCHVISPQIHAETKSTADDADARRYELAVNRR